MRPPLASEIDVVLPLPPWWVTALVIAAGCLAIVVLSLFLARKRRP
jgi:hypothetical protein